MTEILVRKVNCVSTAGIGSYALWIEIQRINCSAVRNEGLLQNYIGIA